MSVEATVQSMIGALEFVLHTKVMSSGVEGNVAFIQKNVDYWHPMETLHWMDGPIITQTDGQTGKIGKIVRVVTLVTIAIEKELVVSWQFCIFDRFQRIYQTIILISSDQKWYINHLL